MCLRGGMSMGTQVLQRPEGLEPLELQLQVVVSHWGGYWDPNSGPLEKQHHTLLTAASSH